MTVSRFHQSKFSSNVSLSNVNFKSSIKYVIEQVCIHLRDIFYTPEIVQTFLCSSVSIANVLCCAEFASFEAAVAFVNVFSKKNENRQGKLVLYPCSFSLTHNVLEKWVQIKFVLDFVPLFSSIASGHWIVGLTGQYLLKHFCSLQLLAV